MSTSGLKRGAEELLLNFSNSQSAIAEAYVKGDIPKHLESFVKDVIDNQHIEEARKRLDRTSWRLEERVVKLEKEVRELQVRLSWQA